MIGSFHVEDLSWIPIFSLWFILSSLGLLSSSFLHFSSNWVFGGSGLWLNISFLRIHFLKLVFLGYHQLLASLSGLCQKYLQFCNVYIQEQKLSPEVFCPQKNCRDKKTWPQPPPKKKTPVAPTDATHAKVGHSSTNQSQKRTSQQSGASGGAAVRRSGGLGRLLGLQRLNQRLTLARWGGMVPWSWCGVKRCCLLVFFPKKKQFTSKKPILTVWEGMEI